MPNKPVWDTSTPGSILKSVVGAKVTEDEIAALRRQTSELYDGMSRQYMSPEEKWHAERLNTARAHALNFQLFSGTPDQVSADFHKRGLINGLIDLGEFEQARMMAAEFDWHLSAEIDRREQAVNRDDQETCNCPREKTGLVNPMVDPAGQHAKEQPVELKRRYALGPQFSKKHGKVVTLWACRHCGDVNAHDHIPDSHEAALEGRMAHEQAAQARRHTAQTYPRDATHGDHNLLRVGK